MTDIPFGPTSSGKQYLSLDYHRCSRAVPPKRCWAIPRPAEYDVFVWADETPCCDGSGHMWGFLFEDGELAVLGTERERIAKFPCPQNETDPWHGYPVHTTDIPQRRPSPIFIEELYQRGVLTKVQKKRIQGSKI